MMYNENLIDKYNDLRENLAELLLLRENIISIRDDVATDDTFKAKVLYKKNIENLEENQLKLEIDVANLMRAGELLKFYEYTNSFKNLTQVMEALKRENENSMYYNKNNFYAVNRLFDNVSRDVTDTDRIFKEIAKIIAPNLNENMSTENLRLWKETLKAKADEDEVALNRILLEVKRLNENFVFDVDNVCESINNIENNLKIVNNEITEITKICRENFDGEKLEEINALIKEIENRNISLKRSIKVLITIRKNMIDAFMSMLPATRILN